MTQTVQRRPDELQGGVLVASVPANHVYVHHIAAEDADGVQRLPDPNPDDPRRSTQEAWWPPVMLDPDWVADADFDRNDRIDTGELQRYADLALAPLAAHYPQLVSRVRAGPGGPRAAPAPAQRLRMQEVTAPPFPLVQMPGKTP